jgi:hypothetical protein
MILSAIRMECIVNARVINYTHSINLQRDGSELSANNFRISYTPGQKADTRPAARCAGCHKIPSQSKLRDLSIGLTDGPAAPNVRVETSGGEYDLYAPWQKPDSGNLFGMQARISSTIQSSSADDRLT